MSLRTLLAAAVALAIVAQGAALADRGGDVALIDHRGRPATLADFRGSFVLMFFGYTHCPDICPTDVAVLSDAVDRLGAAGAHVQPVFVTVDPARDTAEALAAFVAHFHPRLVGLTGAPADIRALADAFRVRYETVGTGRDDDYLIDHTGASYLVGPDGRVLGLFPHGTSAADIAAAIRPLIAKLSG